MVGVVDTEVVAMKSEGTTSMGRGVSSMEVEGDTDRVGMVGATRHTSCRPSLAMLYRAGRFEHPDGSLPLRRGHWSTLGLQTRGMVLDKLLAYPSLSYHGVDDEKFKVV